MFARKGNKEYPIAEEKQEVYVKRGYDIYSEDGKLLKNGAGKSVSVESYKEKEKELAKLKEQNAKLKEQLKELKGQNAEHKEQDKDAKEHSKG